MPRNEQVLILEPELANIFYKGVLLLFFFY